MLDNIIELLAELLIENDEEKILDRDIIIFGLSSVIELSINILTTFLLGYLFGALLESIVFLLSLSFLRSYTGGYHCKKSFSCYCVSSGTVILSLTIHKFFSTSYLLVLGLSGLLISIPLILIFAPMPSFNKPIDKIEQIYYRKKAISHLCIECILSIVLWILGLYGYAFMICFGIIVTGTAIFIQILTSYHPFSS